MESIKEMSHKDLIDGIIKKIGNAANIEMVLEIPQRSLSAMRSQDDILPDELALLRMIYLFPWLTVVAGNNFKPGLDLGICSCGWKGKLTACDTEPDGDWETGYYSIPLCPTCGEPIDDYDFSTEHYIKWVKWKHKQLEEK